MKVIIDLKENKWHNLKSPGAYEWWYFDAIDDKNEYSFVAVIFAGNPFSPDYNIQTDNHLKHTEIDKPNPMNFCALSFNLYFKGRVLYRKLFEYQKNKFSIENKRGMETLSLDKSNFYFDESDNKYFLNINLATADVNNKFKAEFVFSVKSDHRKLKKSSDDISNHFWMPAATVCEVVGKFKFYKNFKRRKTDITGLGYLDHNWGNEPLFQNINEWYRGRIISNEYSVLYYYIKYNENSPRDFKKLLIYKNGKLVSEINDFEIKLKSKKNYWFLSYNSSFKIDAGDFGLNCKNVTKIDNGPFYIRFISTFELFEKGKSVMKEAKGFSEYIKPKRLKSAFLKPFVNLRIEKVS